MSAPATATSTTAQADGYVRWVCSEGTPALRSAHGGRTTLSLGGARRSRRGPRVGGRVRRGRRSGWLLRGLLPLRGTVSILRRIGMLAD